MNGWLRARERQEVVVYTTAGSVLRGVLHQVKRTALVLTEAASVGEDGPTPMAGVVLVPRDQVEAVQAAALGGRLP